MEDTGKSHPLTHKIVNDDNGNPKYTVKVLDILDAYKDYTREVDENNSPLMTYKQFEWMVLNDANFRIHYKITIWPY